MPVFIDQTGQKIRLDKMPKRIISLVPSQTELLHYLGLEKEVIGISKFCVHPPTWFRHKTRVGGTKDLKMDVIHQLQPDLIIANKEENVKEQIEELQKYYPVWISDVSNLDDAYSMMEQIGSIANKKERASQLTKQVKQSFSQLKTPHLKLKTAYMIWQDPYMTTGGDTFIHSMMEAAGFTNMYADKKRYPVITMEDLRKAGCDVLLLSSEPFPFKQKHIDELQPQLPDTKIILADGEMFSWYGSRLLLAPGYFKQLITTSGLKDQ
jgi:ABC-type Fe3+-hydroxamate transport system substrate-binding protein